ncbi:electron transport complex subunit RsxB [Ostreibacterium oceani]|uniref:Electron transport complex subunit RsxB n=1 Tax=Ostreibacterium oceani TaxID=2654998 RepID=A0A6N7EW69_9GAMM|nr:electron transport complex subunit RsxB [Ostreibacterium oceani]MPV85835.1 electron transport complex subunit RsxB [Ostreibacterium oceani]
MLGLFYFILIVAILGGLMVYLHRRLHTSEDSLVAQVNALLPQTQCAQCHYPGCRPYAEAIVRGEAAINQCPPGGQAGVDALAALLNIDSLPIDEAFGPVKPAPELAEIVEQDCIGCTLCIDACPVDAILGASKQMHTIIADECTGCELCLPVCPVDCIIMKPKTTQTHIEIALTNGIPIRRHNETNTDGNNA